MGFLDPICLFRIQLSCRASAKLIELGVRSSMGLFVVVWYGGGVAFRRFRTPSLPVFGIILGVHETTKMFKLF